MIRADRKEQIDKTIERRRKLGHASFPFAPNGEELRYYSEKMDCLDRKADRIVMLKIVGFTALLLGAIALGCWALVSRWG